MISKTEYAQEMWNAEDDEWIQLLSRYHPVNQGSECAVGDPTGLALDINLQTGKELAKWVHEAIVLYLNERVAVLRKTVCEDLGYCNLIRNGVFESDGWATALAISDSLAMYLTGLPVPVVVLSVYVVKRRMLDRICKCEEGSEDHLPTRR